MNRINYLLIIFLLFFTDISAVEIERLALTSKRLSTADGLSSNTVYDILQDKNGFIWFGAAYGLCRYDGYSFTNFYSLSNDGAKRSDATIGNLYKDDENDLLWIHTSTFTFACYDIRKGRFVDYTGKDDAQRSYRRFIRQGNNMWMYDTNNGIRHIVYDNGRFTCYDYSKENGKLPTNHIARMTDDKDGNVWAITNQGLIRIDCNGNISIISEGRRQIDGTGYEGNVISLEADNRIVAYSPDGNVIKEVNIPAHYPRMNYLRSHFVWQGKWILFGKKTVAIDLKTFDLSMPDEWQVPNGWLLDAIDGYFFESNSSGKLWIFPPEGEVRELSLIPDMSYTAERNRRYNVKRGGDGLFYIATYGNGLFIYDFEKDKFRHFSAKDEQPVIATNYLMNLMVDRSGCVWVSQESSGISYISVSEQSVASFVLPKPERKGDLTNFVRMVTTDDNTIIFSTSDNNMYSYDIKTGSLQQTSKQNACVYAYHKDRRGNVWMATRGDGIYVGNEHYNRGGKHSHNVESDHYHDIAEDKKGRIWLSTYEDGLIMAEYEKDGSIKFKQFLARNNNERRQHQIDIDSNDRMWIATYNGIYMLDTSIDEITDNDFRCFNTDNSILPFNEVKCVMCSSDNYIWTGGKGSGAVRCKINDDMTELKITRITTKEGLANNSISSLIEDKNGNIWAATESGLSMIYDKDMKVKSFHFGGNIERNIYSDGSALKIKDGRIIFGTRYGMNIITPMPIDEQEVPLLPSATITDIRINGISANDSSMLKTAPNYCEEITLSYDNNSVALYFSTLDYSGLQSTLYQYYLEGADKGWRPMTSVNYADYTNLSPGKYVFHLRALNHNKWGNEQILAITICQPWYNSWWAWIIYIIIVATITLYMYTNARERLRLREQMRVEKQIAEFRMSFYTNITHEFRTPLAIIQGAVNKLLLDSTSKAAIQTAQRGTKRLLKMVNQLMEFRKVNTGNLRLNLEKDDIIIFIRDIYQDFWNIAEQKELQMTFMPFEKHYTTVFDKQMMETMVYNLLSNAIKYTPDKGNITVRIKKDAEMEMLNIIIEDNGNGITKEQEASLFQPFMQGHMSKGGMGIGLYTSHSMAELHHGKLEYNREDGHTIFTISIPDNEKEYSEEEYKKTLAIDTTEQEQETQDGYIIREPLPDSLNDITVAIIEDDHDMMEQICHEVAKYFNINRYYNGQSALEGIAGNEIDTEKKKLPALIICDVMLPDMEGYDIVKQLKTDADTENIPVIMLTALNDERHQLKCYEAGGDDYMIKPCNYKLLIGRAVQLIKMNHERMTKDKNNVKAENNKVATIEKTAPIIISSADKHFIDKLDAIIAQNIANSDLSVEQIADLMNMGRTKFFNKTKELTGMSPNKYIQNKRMLTAAELLRNGEMTVSEVSYKVGIQDSSYFNKCFKAKFGIVPSKYAKETAAE